MLERFLQQLRFLPDNLSSHLIITMIPLVLSLAISLPLAILLVRRKSLRYPVIAVVSMIQTIPSLALLALMVPLLAGIAILADRFLGVEFSALGFYPTIIALTLYGIMPMLRNTVTGILGVDPAMTEAARGMGMTARQRLWKVELPLAAPVIIAGIRTATVWVVGTATLATPVGQRCLGNYIFRWPPDPQLARRALRLCLGGSRGVRARFPDRHARTCRGRTSPRSRADGRWDARPDLRLRAVRSPGPGPLESTRPYQPPAIAVDSESKGSNSKSIRGSGSAEQGPALRIGSKAFTEQYILSALISRRLGRCRI